MSTPWHDVVASTAISVNALVGSQAAALQTTYATRPLTAAEFKSAVFPFSAIKYRLLMAEERLAHAIANSNNPWRAILNAQTAAAGTPSVLPTAVSGSQIIGLWGSVYDAVDGTAMTENSLKEIRRANSNSNAWRKSAVYWYKIVGQRIYHTRGSVYLDCCVYNAATQKTAIENNSNMLLPDVLAPALVCGALALLLRDSQFSEQAGQFAAYFEAQEKAIKEGSQNDVTHIQLAMAA